MNRFKFCTEKPNGDIEAYFEINCRNSKSVRLYLNNEFNDDTYINVKTEDQLALAETLELAAKAIQEMNNE